MISIRFIINNVIKSISCRRSAPASSSASQFTPWAQPTGGDQCQLVGILESSAARGTCAVERFAGAHPSHFVGPFRSQGHGRPCLSTAHVPRALCSTDISCKQNGVKNGTFLHQILDSANTPAIRQYMLCKPKRRKSCTHANKAIDTREEILDLITSTSRSARESELRLRIAKHLCGRVRPPGRIHVLYFAHL